MKKFLVLAALMVSFIGFGVLVAAPSPKDSENSKNRYLEFQLFAKVLNLVQQYYVKEVDIKKLIRGGIKGMLKELDPHTNYLAPNIFKEFESETSGKFGGLGIEITVKKGVLTVISPIEDTPAYKAGVMPGDKIVGINGDSTKGLSLVEAAQKMRGKNRSKVTLQIFRKGFERPKDFVIKRGIVKIKSVKYTDLGEGYAYVKITSFIENTFKELNSALKKHDRKGKMAKGIIMDLRRNPGGLFDQAIKVSDLFIDKGIIVSTVGRNPKERDTTYAKKVNSRTKVPIVVLIDEYSASASEIVAGALRDNKRAIVMGQRSFGKGSVQSVVKLGDGSGLKLTVARYLTPSGVSIQAEGISPDIRLKNINIELLEKATIKRRVTRERDIRGHLLSDREKKSKKRKKVKKKHTSAADFWWGLSDSKKTKLGKGEKLLKKDFQVLQAFNYLKGWKVMNEFKAGKL